MRMSSAARVVEPPRSPSKGTPPLEPGAVRRTTHLEMRWVDGSLVITGAARDVLGSSGHRDMLQSASVSAEVGPGKSLQRLELHPDHDGLEMLLGSTVASGFRAQVREKCPDLSGTPSGLLLDDLPGAVLIAPYLHLRDMALDGEPPGRSIPPEALSMLADVCAGWQKDGLAMNSVASGNGIPLQDCPPAEPLETGDDPGGWHQMARLEPGTMRRQRRIDVKIAHGPPATLAGAATTEGSTTGATRGSSATLDPVIAVDAMFRDSHGEPDGTEAVLHEYTLAVLVSYGDGRILDIRPVPRVLPFPECPAAVAYAMELKGEPIGELRQAVAAALRGTRGCTHLNDLLRVLGDIRHLVTALPGAQTPGWASTKP